MTCALGLTGNMFFLVELTRTDNSKDIIKKKKEINYYSPANLVLKDGLLAGPLV